MYAHLVPASVVVAISGVSVVAAKSVALSRTVQVVAEAGETTAR